MKHDWIPSTLGHGETMCSRCYITNREAAAIGADECDAPPPRPANENLSQDQIDQEMLLDEEDDDDDRDEAYDSCGRWDQNAPSGLSPQCRLAGTEQCDFECPIGLPGRMADRPA